MSGTNLIDNLIEADRFVLAGLTAYDNAMERHLGAELAKSRSLLAEKRHTEDEIATFEQMHRDRIREARSRLHRELWTRALSYITPDEAI